MQVSGHQGAFIRINEVQCLESILGVTTPCHLPTGGVCDAHRVGHSCTLQRVIGKAWDNDEYESYTKIATDPSLSGVFLT